VNDVAKTSEPRPPKEAYEAPRLEDLGEVDELTRTVGGSPVDLDDS
jgi:hypothetical protein